MSGTADGLSFMFHPDFSKIDSNVILRAMGQAFFSLSLGMGTLITYSSYFSDKTSLTKTAVTVASLDTFVAIMAGVMIFPAVFSYGISPAARARVNIYNIAKCFSADAWCIICGLYLFLY